MPRKKKSVPREFRAIAHEINKLRAVFRRGSVKKDKYGYTKQAVALRARIGRLKYDHAVQMFGFDLTENAARAWAESQLKIRERQVKKFVARKQSLKKARLSPLEIKRHKVDDAGYRVRKLPKYRYFPIRSGYRRGRYEKVDREGNVVGEASHAQAARSYGNDRYWDHIVDLSDTLGITRKDARQLYKRTREAGRKSLAKFKKSEKYKKMSPRMKAGFTRKRFERGHLNALARLFDLYFLWA